MQLGNLSKIVVWRRCICILLSVCFTATLWGRRPLQLLAQTCMLLMCLQ